MKNDSAPTPNILYYVTYYWNQTELDFVLQKYSQLRHFHHSPKRTYPFAIMWNEVAKCINATLVVEANNSHITDSAKGQHYPTIMPSLDTIEIEENTPFFYWQHALIKASSSVQNIPHELPIFITRNTYRFNFAYCDVPKKLKESLWEFSIFTLPFDHWTWILLLFSLLSVGLVLSLNSSIKFIHALLSTFSSLLSSSIGTPTQTKRLKYSFLFILWTLCSIVIHTFYCGVVSSFIIRAPEDDIISDIAALHTKSYKLIFSSNQSRDFMKVLAFNSNFSSLFVMANEAEIQSKESENAEALAFGESKAVVYLWTTVFNLVATATDLILQREKTEDFKVIHRECHVGKKLWNDNRQAFFGLIPPNARMAYCTMQRLMAAGIYRLWMREYEGLAISKRVQDRVKFTSPTKIRGNESENQVVPPLKMMGKVITIFCGWGIGVVLCVIAFIFEMISCATLRASIVLKVYLIQSNILGKSA